MCLFWETKRKQDLLCVITETVQEVLKMYIRATDEVYMALTTNLASLAKKT